MSYDIIRTPGSLIDLRQLVAAALLAGWQPLGAPFRDAETREWCQAVTGLASKPGEVRLHEPKRTK